MLGNRLQSLRGMFQRSSQFLPLISVLQIKLIILEHFYVGKQSFGPIYLSVEHFICGTSLRQSVLILWWTTMLCMLLMSILLQCLFISV